MSNVHANTAKYTKIMSSVRTLKHNNICYQLLFDISVKKENFVTLVVVVRLISKFDRSVEIDFLSKAAYWNFHSLTFFTKIFIMVIITIISAKQLPWPWCKRLNASFELVETKNVQENIVSIVVNILSQINHCLAWIDAIDWMPPVTNNPIAKVTRRFNKTNVVWNNLWYWKREMFAVQYSERPQ